MTFIVYNDTNKFTQSSKSICYSTLLLSGVVGFHAPVRRHFFSIKTLTNGKTMTPLKLAMDYRKVSSNWLNNKFLGSNTPHSEKLSARQIGSACAGKKKLTDIQREFIADALFFPIQFFDDEKQLDTYFIPALESQIKSNYMSSSRQLTYFTAVATLAVNTLYSFLKEHYTLPKLDKQQLLSLTNNIEFQFSVLNKNHIHVCDNNNKQIKKLSDNVLEWLGIKNAITPRLCSMFENRGILLCSFTPQSWYDNTLSFSVVMDDNAIIFLRKDLTENGIRDCLFYELLNIIITCRYGENTSMQTQLNDMFARWCVLQDFLKDYIKKSLSSDVRCYSDICKVMDKLKVTPDNLIKRMIEFDMFDFRKLQSNIQSKFFKICEDIQQFYKNVYMKTCDYDQNAEQDMPRLWNKIKELSYPVEYMSNVCNIGNDIINDFTFNMDADCADTVESKLLFV